MRENHQESIVTKSVAGKGVFPAKWAFTLLFPLRSLLFSARDLMRRIELRDGMSVLEVGPGPGYFSIPMARKMPNGRLVLADIQPEMLAHARRRLEKARKRRGAGKFADIDYHVCDGHSFPFPGQTFDRIVLVTVLGEVDEKAAYLREFHRLLKPDGVLSLTEMAGDPDKLDVEDIRSLGEAAGFAICGRFGGKWNYTVNLGKRSRSDRGEESPR